MLVLGLGVNVRMMGQVRVRASVRVSVRHAYGTKRLGTKRLGTKCL